MQQGNTPVSDVRRADDLARLSSEGTTMEAWVRKLKTAYEAGYYKTEQDEGMQMSFPWQGKTCKDCPFWSNSICQVFAEYRSSSTHTCPYFDPWNRSTA